MTEKQFVYMDLLETEAISVSDDECYYFNEYGTVQKICELLNELHEENQELKSELKIYRNIANCSNCHYHNYDWYDDGDEFEVCDKGNDMSDYICEDWREL